MMNGTRLYAGAMVIAVAAIVLVVFWSAGHVPAQPTPHYVGSAQCATCHEGASEAWSKSHHALAWTEPGAGTVVADFDDTSFAHDGTVTNFHTEGDTYFITVTEKDGNTTRYPVHSVAGIEPLQQYLVETEEGRLQSFDVVWDNVKRAWYHLYPDQDLPPDDGLHWSGPYKNWNARCAECHATGFRKNFANARYASTQAEIGVGCEACHGPGSTHIALANAGGNPPPGFGLTMSYASADTEAAIQQCAGCHSRREAQTDGNPLPGTPYHDAYALSLLRPGLYHADGQILDEVYVYGSFLQSKMYARGVGCSDCHDAHTAELKAEGNAVCTQCHSPAGNAKFPTLALKTYDSPDHHFHEAGTEAAQCVSCHMSERVYMGIDGRRDHSFRVPRPDLTVATGSPDACTSCHTDETPAWAAEVLKARYPQSAHRGPHYGEVLARGRADPVGAAADLAALARDAEQPGIVRATALELLGQGATPQIAEELEPLLSDSDPLVRRHALGVQRAAPSTVAVPRIVGLLDDPVRTVRMAAAREMLSAPIARLPDNIARNLERAMGEWRASLSARLDFPETHLTLGGMALTMRNVEAALGAFREVTRLDPQRVEAWVMLARISAATQGRDAVREVLREARAINPDDPTLAQLEDELNAVP